MNYCKGQGSKGCLLIADDKYTILVGKNPTFWCSSCGEQLEFFNAFIDKMLSYNYQKATN